LIEVRKCAAAEIFDDPASPALFAEYLGECANPVLGCAAPDRAAYEALEQLGPGQCFGGYVASKLCGFAFVMAGELPFHPDGHAAVERLFVASAARATGLGAALMKAIETHARDAGCATITYSAPAGSRLAMLLFLLWDEYRNTNHIFARKLR
jgi:GNAT superfamily N-acetyltransferase